MLLRSSVSYLSGFFLFTTFINAGSGDKDKPMEAEETPCHPHTTPKLFRTAAHWQMYSAGFGKGTGMGCGKWKNWVILQLGAGFTWGVPVDREQPQIKGPVGSEDVQAI